VDDDTYEHKSKAAGFRILNLRDEPPAPKRPGIRESITEAEADVEEGRVYSEEQIRAEFNVPKGDR